MLQRYKVFINQSIIYFTNNKENLTVSERQSVTKTIVLHDAQKVSFSSIINELEENTYTYLILTNQLDKTWGNFRSLFQYRIAGGGLVQNKHSDYLLILRNQKWDLPKGHIEKNENIETGAVREVEEETGIHTPKIQNKITETFHTYLWENQRVLKHTYWFFMLYAGNEYPTPQTEEGISKAEWKNLKETQELISQSYQSIQDVWMNYLETVYTK